MSWRDCTSDTLVSISQNLKNSYFSGQTLTAAFEAKKSLNSKGCNKLCSTQMGAPVLWIFDSSKGSLEAVVRWCSAKKVVFRNFAKFRGKYLCQSLFLNTVSSDACNFIKKETLAQVFFCEIWKISKTPFSIEHLWWLLLDRRKVSVWIWWDYLNQ